MLAAWTPLYTCTHKYKSLTSLLFAHRVRTLVNTVNAFSDKKDSTALNKGQGTFSKQVGTRSKVEVSFLKSSLYRKVEGDGVAAGSRSYRCTAKLCKELEYTLYSVDQIREEESPWKGLIEIASTERSAKKGSPFKRRLQEHKKIRILYGYLSKKTLDRYLREVHRPEDLLLALESRLEIVLKRSALFPSIQSARIAIMQGGVSVNGTIVRSSRYHCTPGDYVQVVQQRVKKSVSLSEDMSIVAARQSQNQLSCHDNLQSLFVFSELLQLFDRKSGRLHTSAFSDFKTITSTPLTRNPINQRRTPLRKAFHGFHENHRARISHNPEHEDTRPFFASLPKSITQGRVLLSKKQDKQVYTDLPENNQLFSGEKAELERPLRRAVGSRPLHLEVSYRNLCVIFLYPPQRICIDISIDLSLLF